MFFPLSYTLIVVQVNESVFLNVDLSINGLRYLNLPIYHLSLWINICVYVCINDSFTHFKPKLFMTYHYQHTLIVEKMYIYTVLCLMDCQKHDFIKRTRQSFRYVIIVWFQAFLEETMSWYLAHNLDIVYFGFIYIEIRQSLYTTC